MKSIIFILSIAVLAIGINAGDDKLKFDKATIERALKDLDDLIKGQNSKFLSKATVSKVGNMLKDKSGRLNINVADAVSKLKTVPDNKDDVKEIVNCLSLIKVSESLDPIMLDTTNKLNDALTQLTNGLKQNVGAINDNKNETKTEIKNESKNETKTDVKNENKNSTKNETKNETPNVRKTRDLSSILPFDATSQLNFTLNLFNIENIVSNMVNLLNNRSLSQTEKHYLNNITPNLINSNAKSASEVIETIQPIFAFNLAVALNDSSIASSRAPLISALKNLVKELLIGQQQPAALSDIRYQNAILSFFDNLIETGDLKESFENLKNEFYKIFDEQTAQDLKLIINNYWPELSNQVEDQDNLQDILGILATYAEDSFTTFLTNLQN